MNRTAKRLDPPRRDARRRRDRPVPGVAAGHAAPVGVALLRRAGDCHRLLLDEDRVGVCERHHRRHVLHHHSTSLRACACDTRHCPGQLRGLVAARARSVACGFQHGHDRARHLGGQPRIFPARGRASADARASDAAAGRPGDCAVAGAHCRVLSDQLRPDCHRHRS